MMTWNHAVRAQFVEGDVVVLHQLPPAPITGTFGWAVADLTDIDNPPDGVFDLISGALGSNRVLVYSGATGALLHDIPGPVGATNLGYAIADAGDVNNDGVNDIIAGAPGSGFGTNPGFAAVFSGVDASVIWSWTGEAATDGLGSIQPLHPARDASRCIRGEPVACCAPLRAQSPVITWDSTLSA